MVKRKIVRINEELCNGCGKCIGPCAKGAIELQDGKARVIREELCDGAGFCIPVCPTGALSIKEREAPEFSEEAVRNTSAKEIRILLPMPLPATLAVPPTKTVPCCRFAAKATAHGYM